MGTNCVIGLLEDDRVSTIYVNFDSYISHMGVVLTERFNTIDKIKKLLEKGSASHLGDNEDQDAFYDDEGFNGSSMSLGDFEHLEFYDYRYLFRHNQWEYWNYNSFMGSVENALDED